MSPAFWNDFQVVSDSLCGDFERSNDDGSALFAHQPHRGTRETDFTCPTPLENVKVFKDIATVPNITLNFAQMKDVMPDGHLAWSPSLSLSSIEADSYTPPLSLTPASINSDLSPFANNDPIFDSFARSSRSVSPLSFNSHCTSDDVSNGSPSSETIGLPSLISFTGLPDQPECHEPTFNSRISSPVSSMCPTNNTNHDTIIQRNEQEEEPSAKRCRYASSEPKPESLFVSLPSHQKSVRIGKTALKLKKVGAATMTGRRRPQSPASASKSVLELSPGNWLKLSSPSMTKRTSQAISYPSPPPSLSPLASLEPSNARKRKRAVNPPFITHLQPPLPPPRFLLGESDGDDPCPMSPASESKEGQDTDFVDDSVHQDFITAGAMIQRRSERIRAPISYVDCDEDVFEKPTRGKATGMKAKAISDEDKTPNPRTVLKKSRHGSRKRPQNTNGKCECPFQIICPIPFGRFSDVVRHLESNVLHTHAEKSRWECSNCGARLARSDSYKRHVNAHACGKRAPTEKVKPVYSSDVERELERIRNSNHPAVLAAKERL
ncbi:hypothetical protein C0992_006498 [Termitomyces sp. T32_za158]|nr:hypothetical protein C0992_006498 [Termitomyces sp. T32_za158]